MRHHLVRAAIGMIAAIALAGCATGLRLEQRQTRARQALADDILSLNQAYGEAMGGQILLNILRARDRLPTQYVVVSELQRTSSIVDTQGLNIGGIELGDIGSPWGKGELSFERTQTPYPTYTVGAFAAADVQNIMFQPVGKNVFADYWNAGWPGEILMLLMVERVVVVERRAGAQPSIIELGNDAGSFERNCIEGVNTGGCEFVRQVRTLAVRVRALTPNRQTDLSGVCGLVAAYELPPATAPRPHAADQLCDAAARVIVGETQYTFVLRTFDDIVFYIGELLRSPGDAAANSTLEAPILVGAAGLAGGGAGVPLFRVVRGAEDRPYAASVVYGGARYYAGPAVSRECERGPREGACADTHDLGDRSSLVLALLSQLLLRNQSAESQPRPPLVLIAP